MDNTKFKEKSLQLAQIMVHTCSDLSQNKGSVSVTCKYCGAYKQMYNIPYEEAVNAKPKHLPECVVNLAKEVMEEAPNYKNLKCEFMICTEEVDINQL